MYTQFGAWESVQIKYLYFNNKTQGLFSTAEIKAIIKDNNGLYFCWWCWWDGFEEWKPAHETLDIGLLKKDGSPFAPSPAKVFEPKPSHLPASKCSDNLDKPTKTMQTMKKEILDQHRIAALDLYQAITKNFNIQPSSSLKHQHINIEKNEFKVAVIGKVKSGKSTFINAILGETLMPSDVREATCAIVEIFKSDTKYISVEFMDGHQENVEDDLSTPDIDEAYEFLKKVATVQQKYRNLPIAQLNDLLIEHFDDTKKESVFLDGFIDAWIYENDLKNIHHLSQEEFTQSIKEYLEEHKNGYHIPVTIKVGFPHKFKFDQFRIIDTPGIGTTSGLGEKTNNYIEQVDAVIYLNKESPTEESLLNAWNNVISERAKKNTFLVLTHRSCNTSANSDTLYEETIKTFPQIPANRIFTIDSLTELALSEFYGKEFKAIEDICDSNEEYDLICSKALRKANGNVPDLLNILEKQSNMADLRNELQNFSGKATALQLHSFIEELRNHLEVKERDKASDLALYKSQHQDPQIFATEATKQSDEIEKLKAEISDKSATIKADFCLSVPGEKRSEFEMIFSDFEAKINGKCFSSSDSDTKSSVESYVEKIHTDIHNKIEVFVEQLKKDITQQINLQTSTFDGDYSITVPKIVLSEIWGGAAEKATITTRVKYSRSGWQGMIKDWFGKGTIKVQHLNIDKFYDSAKTEIIKQLSISKQMITTSTDGAVKDAINRYEGMMNKKLGERKLFLDELAQKTLSNDELRVTIETTNDLIVLIQNKIKTCKTIEGELG